MSEVEDYDWSHGIPITADPEAVLVETAHELRHPISAIKGYAELILIGVIDDQEAAEQILKLTSNTEVVLNAVFEYLQERQSSKE